MKNSNDLPDLTILGNTADSLGTWIRANNRLKPGSEPLGIYRAIPLAEDAVPPNTIPESWVAIGKLGATPGLLGVIVLDLQTSGYEPSQGQSRSTSPAKLLPRFFGYSQRMRSEFLRETGVDPIDLVPKNCFSSVNVNPFFFSDYELMGSPREVRSDTEESVIAPFVDRWNIFRTSKMKAGLKRFSDTVLSKFDVTIWADLVLNSSNRPMTDIIPVTAYRAADGFEYDAGEAGVPFGAMYATPVAIRFLIDPVLPETANTEMMMKMMSQADMRKRNFSVCYDISKLKIEDSMKFLDKWFVPQK